MDILDSLLSEELCSIWDFWTIPYEFLGVPACNADEFATFAGDIYIKLRIRSEYDRPTCTYMGTPLTELFLEGALTVLLKAKGKYAYIDNPRQRKAVERLLKFLENLEKDGNHLACLRKLHSLVEDIDESKSKHIEARIQAVLACHLFTPLLTDGEVIVDSLCYSSGSSSSSPKPECPFCHEDLKTGNTNFGVKDLWHGRADMFVKARNSQKIVKVCVNKVETDDEEGCGEPVTKRTELYRPEESAEQTYSYCLPEVKPMLEGKLCKFLNIKPYKQAITQTILNTFLAVKNNKSLENVLVPSFLVCQNSVFINFYNMKHDVLFVQSMPMKFFKGKNDVNYAAFFSVWLALNIEVFPSEIGEDFYATAKKSGFIDLLVEYSVYETYKNDINCLFTLSPSWKKINEESTEEHSIAPQKRKELIAWYIKKKTGN